jgi:hypothetical protein
VDQNAVVAQRHTFGQGIVDNREVASGLLYPAKSSLIQSRGALKVFDVQVDVSFCTSILSLRCSYGVWPSPRVKGADINKIDVWIAVVPCGNGREKKIVRFSRKTDHRKKDPGFASFHRAFPNS